MRFCTLVLATIVVMATRPALSLAAEASFTPVPASDRTTVRGISADGTVAVGEIELPSHTRAFRWVIGSGVELLAELPPATGSVATGVSNDGSVATGTANGQAYRWTSNTGMTGLGDLPGGNNGSSGHAVSGDGATVAGISHSAASGASHEAFRWCSDFGMMGLGDLPGGSFRSEAFGVSNDGGAIVGNSSSAQGNQAFRWTNDDGMVELGDLPGGEFFTARPPFLATAGSLSARVLPGRFQSRRSGGRPSREW